MGVHSTSKGGKVAGARGEQEGERADGSKAGRVTGDRDSEGVTGAVEPVGECLCVSEGSSRLPSFGVVVEPADAVAGTTARAEALSSDRVYSVARGGASWEGPRIISRVSRRESRGGSDGANPAANRETDMDVRVRPRGCTADGEARENK